MPKSEFYQRGPFWLDHARVAEGRLASPNFYICWYDEQRGRQRRKSAGTSDVQLASEALDRHYLAARQPDEAGRAVYTVIQGLTDYYQEVGSLRSSADAIRSRLLLLTRFFDAEAAAGRLPEPFLPADLDDEALIERFRNWGLADPIVALRKNEEGNWVREGKVRERSKATVEESVIALKAAMNLARRRRRIAVAPMILHRVRDEVTAARNDRLSLGAIGELLDYTNRGAGRYGYPARLMPLRRYLIAAVCTLARPDAILDLSVAPGRGQWLEDVDRLDLNPAGRIQTNKHRPVLPVATVLHDWLRQTDEWFVCRENVQVDQASQEFRLVQSGVVSVRSAWDTARAELGLPAGWGVKLLRHSMATIVANRGVDPFQLKIAMGHQALGGTTERYVIYAPDYLSSFLETIEAVLADLAPISGGALVPESRQLAQACDSSVS